MVFIMFFKIEKVTAIDVAVPHMVQHQWMNYFS